MSTISDFDGQNVKTESSRGTLIFWTKFKGELRNFPKIKNKNHIIVSQD